MDSFNPTIFHHWQKLGQTNKSLPTFHKCMTCAVRMHSMGFLVKTVKTLPENDINAKELINGRACRNNRWRTTIMDTYRLNPQDWKKSITQNAETFWLCILCINANFLFTGWEWTHENIESLFGVFLEHSSQTFFSIIPSLKKNIFIAPTSEPTHRVLH